MGYSKENYRLVREEYENKHREAINAAEVRRAELHRVIPGVEKIDRELSATGIKLMGAALGVSPVSVNEIRDSVNALRRQRAARLSAAGYQEDYYEARFECSKCQDTGYV